MTIDFAYIQVAGISMAAALVLVLSMRLIKWFWRALFG
jgi:hypothetical protein